MTHAIICFMVLLATIYAFSAVTNIEQFIVSTIKEVGVKNTIYMMMGAVSFLIFFISTFWILSMVM